MTACGTEVIHQSQKGLGAGANGRSSRVCTANATTTIEPRQSRTSPLLPVTSGRFRAAHHLLITHIHVARSLRQFGIETLQIDVKAMQAPVVSESTESFRQAGRLLARVESVAIPLARADRHAQPCAAMAADGHRVRSATRKMADRIHVQVRGALFRHRIRARDLPDPVLPVANGGYRAISSIIADRDVRDRCHSLPTLPDQPMGDGKPMR
jgi:hypothetical protein